jgi:hypothetical protein
MREFELSIESLKLWRTLDRDLGIETGFNQCGILYMTEDEKVMEGHRVWLEKARRLAGDAFDTRQLDSKGVAALLPGATKSFKGGLYTAGDARALRGTRHRNERWAGQRGRHRARHDSLPECGGSRRGMVAAVLRQPRYRRAATVGESLSTANRTA